MAVLGYCAAVGAGAFFAAVAVVNVGAPTLPNDIETGLHTLVLATTLSIAGFQWSFVPAAVAIAVTEGLKIRGFVAYLIIGVVVGFLMALPVRSIVGGGPIPPLNFDLLRLSMASGAVGGLIYWVIAGRTAGRWLEMRWFEPNRR